MKQGIISSPVGPIFLESSDTGLRKLSILKEPAAGQPQIQYGYDGELKDIVEQLKAYFNHELENFRVALDLKEYPDFHKRVWRVLCSIPYGKTRTYGEIAHFLNNPKGARAVGNASAKNPVAIIIPCHRVLGKNGELTGYAYGKSIKQFLLELERPGRFVNQGELFGLNGSLFPPV